MYGKLRGKLKNRIFGTISSIIIYTVIWLLCVAIILFIFNSHNKTFLWAADGGDGVYQHFVSFQYLCEYLQDLIQNGQGKGLFNFTLGQGMDILTTLNSYDFTDPISVLCALLFPLSEVSRYTLMIFIKLYLIGISFIFYCHVVEYDNVPAVTAGAVAYCFSGAVLYTFARHPNFINWAYLFPFLLGGVELYFRKVKKLPIILFVFWNVITSYYTFYMNVLLVVIYVVIQVICKVVKDKKLATLRTELIKCLKLLGVCFIGVLLSAFVLFPTIYAYLHNNRIGEITGYTSSMLHYNLGYYVQMFLDLFAPYSGQYNGYIGFNVVLIIPIIFIFTKKKQHTTEKSLLVFSLLMLCIPAVGLILNGLGYVTNRWTYVLPFYASIILVAVFADLKEMSVRDQIVVFLVAAGYMILSFILMSQYSDVLYFAAVVMMLLVVVIAAFVIHFRFSHCEPVLLSLVIFGACFEVVFTFSEIGGDYVDTFLDASDIESSYTDYSSAMAADLDEGSFYRVEMEEDRTNVNGYNHVNGTGFWWSMVPQDTMDYYTKLALSSVPQNCYVFGLDGRTGLMELASVKYYTRPAEEDGLIPYGYEEIPSSDDRYQIYENQLALPIGYTYTDYISASDYAEMNGVEKEQALLQGVVLEEPLEGFPEINVISDYKALDYEITQETGLTWDDDRFEVVDSDGELEISVVIPGNYEIYLYLVGTELDEQVERMTLRATRVSGESSVSGSAQVTSRSFSWAEFQDDVAINLGCGLEGENTITLKFNKQGILYCNEMQILAVPMSAYEECADKLGECVLENVEMGDDKISGTISLPEERILQLSVPYSEGWKAYVDGEEVTVLKSDVMYMAIPLSSGDHVVEFCYETPYLRLGVIASVVTVVLFAVYEILQYRKRLKRAREDT